MITWKAYSLIGGITLLTVIPFGWLAVAIAAILINITCFKLNIKAAKCNTK